MLLSGWCSSLHLRVGGDDLDDEELKKKEVHVFDSALLVGIGLNQEVEGKSRKMVQIARKVVIDSKYGWYTRC